MIKFYDLMFLKVYDFYSKYKEEGAKSSSAGIIGGLQAMNILTLIILYLSIYNKKEHLNKIIAFLIIIFFQITTYIRYIHRENNSILKTKENWLNESILYKARITNICKAYILLSIFLFFGVAIYFGNKQ